MSGVVIWLTGLPSSGKTTLADAVRHRLLREGTSPCVLDGDLMRAIIAPNLGYSEPDRADFYAALARLAAELAKQGLVVLVPATAHLRAYRQHARELSPSFVEVWVTTPLTECRRRDSKGLYAAAANAPGELPGVDIPYEPPAHAEVLAAGADDLVALDRILSFVRIARQA
jgi:adenylylsulfate kinase